MHNERRLRIRSKLIRRRGLLSIMAGGLLLGALWIPGREYRKQDDDALHASSATRSPVNFHLRLPTRTNASIDETPVSFNRDIRPIFSNHCYQCHGPDEQNRAADLRLDMPDGVDRAFAPGDLDNSEGWFRITSNYDDERMPPPEVHKDLSDEQIDLIGKWIEEGATWEDHWSFMPPSRPSMPECADDAWVSSAIDAFVLRGLRERQLSPNSPSAKERLIRRVTLDLTGLPPTLAEIDAFLADDRPDAYVRVVDRLLASPRFGERLALFWMDAARYGDSSVFHADGPRDMWTWRDWVIRAFNDGMGFDQFTIEQLAGDLLPAPTWQQLTASGFNRNHGTTDEGGAIDEEYRVEYIVDRVKTTGTVWLGLTLECAQCHDHKYDPISQEDYYRLFAYFNQSVEKGMQTRNGNAQPLIDVPNVENEGKLLAARDQLTELENGIAEYESSVRPKFEQWQASTAAEPREEILLPPDQIAHWPLDEREGDQVASSVESVAAGRVHGSPAWDIGHLGGAIRFDASNFADLGDIASFEGDQSFSFGAWIWFAKNSNGAPIARMDPGNSHRGFDIHLSGGRVEFHLIHKWPENAIKVTCKQAFPAEEWHHVFVTYDGSKQAAGVKIYLDGVNQEWDIQQDGLTGSTITDKPFYLGRRHSGSTFKGMVDDVRVFSRVLDEAEVAILATLDPIAEILEVEAAERTDSQNQTLWRHFLAFVDDQHPAMELRRTELRNRITELEKPLSTVMVMRDVPEGRMTYVLERGSYDSPLEDRPVEPGVLDRILTSNDEMPKNRLGLAAWIVNPDHPLTSRVTVNRFWQLLFGTGLVPTSEDFGAQGNAPSHPDLLDWLAIEFVENDWDVKRSIRQIVLSSAYCQSSRADQDRLLRDPVNRWISRGPKYRLPGETIRDQALAVSGLLVPSIGGPGVKPYQPPGLWNEVSLSGNVRFVQDHGAKLYRRSMYTYWKRSAPAPSMILFDVPTREKCIVRRSRTNTPLQALVTLNDTQFVEASRMLAERMLQSNAAPAEGDQQQGLVASQIKVGYRLATGVEPDEFVLGVLVEAFEEELIAFDVEPERATALLAVGEHPRDESLDATRHAAMTVVASIILNLDESLTKH